MVEAVLESRDYDRDCRYDIEKIFRKGSIVVEDEATILSRWSRSNSY